MNPFGGLPATIRIGRGCIGEFRGENPTLATIGDKLSDDLLRRSTIVDTGAVYEVYASLRSSSDDAPCLSLLPTPNIIVPRQSRETRSALRPR